MNVFEYFRPLLGYTALGFLRFGQFYHVHDRLFPGKLLRRTSYVVVTFGQMDQS